MKIIPENYILKDSSYLRVNAYSTNSILYVAHGFGEIYLVSVMKFGVFPEFI